MINEEKSISLVVSVYSLSLNESMNVHIFIWICILSTVIMFSNLLTDCECYDFDLVNKFSLVNNCLNSKQFCILMFMKPLSLVMNW